jgi:hypothetical protein
MLYTKYLTLFLFISCASGSPPYTNEWKTVSGEDLFFAGVPGQASEKAISAESVSMKQRTCTEATKTLSTSSKITQYLLQSERQELSEAEIKDLSKHILQYRITPTLVECQPGAKDSIFGGIDWATCQCLYSYKYPGGREQWREDILKAR